MRILLISFFLFSSYPLFAQSAYWDLDSLVSKVNSGSQSVGLQDGTTVQITLDKNYILKFDEIRRKISQQARIYPKIFISNEPFVNAYATWHSGQPVTFYTLGLLEKISRDYDALAAVVGHEFAHLSESHSDSQATANLVIEILKVAAIVFIDSQYGGASRNPYRGVYQTALDAGGGLAKTIYSRSDEYEADEYGLKFMVGAGFDPMGAVRLHNNIIPSNASFFDSHPSSSARIQNLRNYADNQFNKPSTQVAQTRTTKVAFNKPISNKERKQRVVNNPEKYGFLEKPFSREKIESSKKTIKDYEDECFAEGLERKSSQFTVCLFQKKREDSIAVKIKKQNKTLEEDNPNLPIENQIGLVLYKNNDKDYFVFSSTIYDILPVGTKINVLTESGTVAAKITQFYDGYYSAKTENLSNIDIDSRITIN
jgi:Zn-dependent protease with chaperone function